MTRRPVARPVHGAPPIDPKRAIHWVTCSFDGCTRQPHSRLPQFGLCGEHLGRMAIGLLGVKGEASTSQALAALESRSTSDPTPPTQRPKRRASEGVVYYAQVGPHIKIGHTKDLPARLSAFRNAVADVKLLGSEPGGAAIEGRRHRQFEGSRVTRELFTPTPELLDWIEGLP